MKDKKRMLVAIAVLMLAVAFLASACCAQSDTATETYAEESYAGNSIQDVMEDTTDEDLVFDEIFTEADTACEDCEEAAAAPQNSEEYGQYSESPFLSPLEEPLSTFSIDVDTASYSNIRRYLSDGALPPEDAVRVEECINYFSYNYSKPMGNDPVSVGVTVSDCPWNAGRYLARVTVNAEELDLSEAPDGNIVFLLDVSGSMDSADKLPLVKSALTMLSENLSSRDTVSIVVYAGASGVVLDGCRGDDTRTIEAALDYLSAGGSPQAARVSSWHTASPSSIISMAATTASYYAPTATSTSAHRRWTILRT